MEAEPAELETTPQSSENCATPSSVGARESIGGTPPLQEVGSVSMRDLFKIYSGRRAATKDRIVALEAFHLDIAPGEIFGLIGPNGAGKTTLLRILATLLVPTQGEAFVSGYSCSSQKEEVCGRLGFMPELFPLYDELTVQEYLEFFALAYQIPRGRRSKAVDSVIELTDLGVRREAYAGSLSKGMRQRLLLAKTMLHDPEVLLLDEPTSGMDPQARIEFRGIVQTMSALKKTVIVSSHILSDLSSICSSIAIVERGQLRVSGSIDEVKTALQFQAEVELRTLDSDRDVVAIVQNCDGVASVSGRGPVYRLHYDGNAATRAKILKHLLDAGVPVTDFRDRPTDLEDIFMRVGANEVQ